MVNNNKYDDDDDDGHEPHEFDADFDDDGWGESFMDEMEEVNPGWVSGEESD